LGYPACFGVQNTKADDFRLQVYRSWKRQSKTNGRRSPFR